MFRRGFSISSPIIEALSRPLRENAIVDQNTMSLRCVLGTIVSALGPAEAAVPIHRTVKPVTR
ncbi:MAG TPA: hypothetical protein VGP44_11410 [Gemmatimonadales bacterium]|nr:hypothetical protein [Gemmatimonadales bacterium]